MKKGWFNWVDLVILLVIIAGVFVVFNRDSLFGRDGVVQETVSGRTLVVMTAKAINVPTGVAEAFVVGDAPMAGTRDLDGKIISVEVKPTPIVIIKDGQVVQGYLEGYSDIYVTYEVYVNRYNQFMEAGGQEIKVGQAHYIKTAQAELFGMVTAVKIVE